MTDLGTCAGERRSCSAPAVVVRQGRPLCAACADRRRAARSQRKDRARTAEAERARLEARLAALRILRETPAPRRPR